MTSTSTTNDYAENLLVHFRRVESLRREAMTYPGLDLDSRQLADLELLLNRAYYPLRGYNSREDYETILDRMRLADNTLWPIPVCLDVTEKFAAALTPGQQVALNDQEGFMLAVLTVREIWQPDKVREAEAVYGTADSDRHPGVRLLFTKVRPWYLSGIVEGLHLPIHYDFNDLRQTPAEIHRRFFQNGWRRVVGFHTTKVLHRAEQAAMLKAARDAGANILLQPAVPASQAEGFEHFTRTRCYQALMKQFPRSIAALALIPFDTRFAGPREALWQAMIRKNYGCSHFAVSDDHADPFAGGVGDERFYPRHAAQELVRSHEGESCIEMVPVTAMAYVEDKAEYLPIAGLEDRVTVKSIPPAELRRRLEHDLEIPPWFSYPEVVAELRQAYPPRHRQGFTIFFSGLSGSGKSTLAKVLLVKFLEMRDRPVTLLDGDIVRKNLSSELTFSQEHRNLNITRIGFVASEITKNGGIAICAPIAPYHESRRANRELISRYGGYIQVYVSTPLETCEQRDRKGLYAKARAGLVKGVTGVSDPYEVPRNPDITIDTTDISPTEAAQEVLLYLEEQGYIR